MAAQTQVVLRNSGSLQALLKFNLLTHTSNMSDRHTMIVFAEAEVRSVLLLQVTGSPV